MHMQKNIKCLIIEDNEDHAILISRYLEEITAFSEVSLCRSLMDAVEFIRNHHIDVAFLDLTLPDCHQTETVEKFRKHHSGAIIVLTSLDDFTIGMRCIKEGADDFYSKDDLPSNKIHFLKAVLFSVERRKLSFQLQKTIKELERKNDDIEQFAFVASHDLQAPLRHIIGNIDIIQEEMKEEPNEEIRFSMEAITKSASRMQTLIKDLLNFSRVGRLNLRTHFFEFSEIFDEVVDILSDKIKEASAEVILNESCKIYADQERIGQVIQNLIENSIKFVEKNIKPRVIVSCIADSESQKIIVRDNGIGIPSHLKEKIFQIFQRAHPPSEYDGTGIGLAICKKIIELHEGRISAESKEGSGSQLLIELKNYNDWKGQDNESSDENRSSI